MKFTKHILIFGRVQGVFFRESMCIKANEFGLTGWVRNRQDGSLEAMVQGVETQIDALIEWARHGPENAHVTSMAISDGYGDYTDFRRVDTV